MKSKKILFFSGSVGLGHVIRDLAIANELHLQYPNIKIDWLAAPPATNVLEKAGEHILPEAKFCSSLTSSAESVFKGGHRINLFNYVFEARKVWNKNVEIFQRAIEKQHYDLTIGDETYEIVMAFKKDPALKTIPFVFILDFIGIEPMGSSIREKVILYLLNKGWASDFKQTIRVKDLSLFVGELEDVPDKQFGFLLPNRRDYAQDTCEFIGYILQFHPDDYADKSQIRQQLGFGNEPLIICSVGGTSVGKEILELCGKAYPIVAQHIPDLRMLFVAGPRLSAESLNLPQGAEVKEYVPRLYEHFAASDLAIVQGSGTTTLELTALQRPFIYFPLKDHYEQEVLIADRLNRHRAGIKMNYADTTSQALAENILSNLGKKVDYASIPIDGAKKAVQLIGRYL